MKYVINAEAGTQTYPFTHEQCVSVCWHAELRHFLHSFLCPAAAFAKWPAPDPSVHTHRKSSHCHITVQSWHQKPFVLKTKTLRYNRIWQVKRYPDISSCEDGSHFAFYCCTIIYKCWLFLKSSLLLHVSATAAKMKHCVASSDTVWKSSLQKHYVCILQRVTLISYSKRKSHMRRAKMNVWTGKGRIWEWFKIFN